MILETFPVGPLQCNCTLLGDEATGEAIVIDPGDEVTRIHRRLTALGLIEEDPSALLRTNYFFLRRIESVLRRVENTSISKIPVDDREQQRLAKRLGFTTAAEFLKTYRHTTRKTREIYEQLFPAS